MRKVCLLICFTNIPPTANSIPCISCIFSSKIAWHILLEKFTDQHNSINNKIHFIFFKYLESYYPQSIGLGLIDPCLQQRSVGQILYSSLPVSCYIHDLIWSLQQTKKERTPLIMSRWGKKWAIVFQTVKHMCFQLG